MLRGGILPLTDVCVVFISKCGVHGGNRIAAIKRFVVYFRRRLCQSLRSMVFLLIS